jgi:hypothetical protein
VSNTDLRGGIEREFIGHKVEQFGECGGIDFIGGLREEEVARVLSCESVRAPYQI